MFIKDVLLVMLAMVVIVLVKNMLSMSDEETQADRDWCRELEVANVEFLRRFRD